MLDPLYGFDRASGTWSRPPCCKQLLDDVETYPTQCPECGTRYVLTPEFEVWPEHMLFPTLILEKALEEGDG